MIRFKSSRPTGCNNIEPDVVLYAYGKCLGVEIDRIESHLRGCSSCRSFLEELHSRAVERDELPQSFWDNYSIEMRRKLGTIKQKSSWRRVFFSLPPWPVPALGTALVLILGLTLTFTRGVWRSEDLPPEEKVLLEVLPVVQNLEFFETMHYLESMDFPEDLEDV